MPWFPRVAVFFAVDEPLRGFLPPPPVGVHLLVRIGMLLRDIVLVCVSC